jgi:hypothetical protein
MVGVQGVIYLFCNITVMGIPLFVTELAEK